MRPILAAPQIAPGVLQPRSFGTLDDSEGCKCARYKLAFGLSASAIAGLAVGAYCKSQADRPTAAMAGELIGCAVGVAGVFATYTWMLFLNDKKSE